MKILITGGAGFIGSHLSRALLTLGHQVLVLDDLSTGSYDNIADIDDGKNFRLIVDSVNNSAIVDECVKEVDQVYHLASAVGVKLIIEQPVRTIESIAGGTECVLKACARYRRPFLLTSTSEVYGKSTEIPFNEDGDTVMGPTSKRRWSYACAKALDEFLAQAYWIESKLPVKVVRLFNTVGPRQTGQYGMVLPCFVGQALAGKPITVYGNGTQSRCFGHVADVVNGLISVMNSPKANGEVINLGNNQEISIGALAERIKELSGSKSEIVYIPYSEAYGPGFEDMHRRVPDLAKAERIVGYRPTKSLDDIIRDVIADKSK